MNELITLNIDAIHSRLKDNGFEYQALYPLYEFPLSCPWQFEPDSQISQIIESIFQPIKANLPQTTQMLKERCQNIFALLYQNEWYLLYGLKVVLTGENIGLQLLGGGQATTKPQLRSKIRELGWTIPNELKLFYQVHNGFGDFSLPWKIAVWDMILPDWKLSVLGEYVDRGDVTGFEPNDLLEFFPDGTGNGQFFHREGENTSNFWTVDWDHETGEIGKRERFWDFVDRRLSQVERVKGKSAGSLNQTAP